MSRPDPTPLPGVDPRFARSARRWLVAYPRDWREERADEVTSLLADLVAPGARHVGVRAGLPLLWSGLATRRRRRPPLTVVVRYRLLGLPVPARWRAWVRADLESPGRPLRELPWRLLSLAPVLALVVAGLDAPHEALGLTAYLLALAAAECSFPALRRRRAAERHLLPSAGEVATAGGVRRATVLRDRVAAVPAVDSALRALAVLGVGAAGVVGVAAARGGVGAGTAVVASVALVVGLALALLAGRGRRLLADRPPQHGRRLVALEPATAVAAPLSAAALVTLSAAFLVGGDVHALAGTVLLAAAITAAPVLVAARRWAARWPGLAAVDLVRALAAGRPAAVDLPVPGFAPVDEDPPGPSAVPA